MPTQPHNPRRRGLALVVLVLMVVGGVTGILVVLDSVAPRTPAIDPGAIAAPDDDSLMARRVRAVGNARLLGVEGLTDWIDEQRERVAQATPETLGIEWQALAFGLSERCSSCNDGRGIRVATPLYDEVPEAIERDVTEALEALENARSAGFEDSESYRIEAMLLSCRVIDLASAMRWDGRIKAATAKAFELDPNNPRAHVATAVREVLLPSWLGQDPEAALERLVPAADALPNDERPLVFAAFAAHLLGKDDLVVDLLDRASTRRPNGRYARVVLERLRSGSDESPFAGDVVETYGRDH
jgi:hypothetical protein